MRRQFSSGRLGRRLGGLLAVALAAAVAHWFPELGNRPSEPAHRAEAPDPARPAARDGSAHSGAAVPVPPGRYALAGKVVSVPDGDTVALQVGGRRHRVRLDSIDSPEAGHGAEQPGQPYADAARRHLEQLVGGMTLTAQCYEEDQFERDVCALILPDGSSANRAQVAAGFAWAYTARRGEYLRDDAMPGLQRQARDARRGLWQQGGAVEPWKWRYECWRNRRC
ncbi:thermonuclease family protein [Bordetella genomosp. 7]|uniref:thermonuclease family protein n=1 Tax=Bordetella genomosp. 7 TaxID=1416805 RepID=UPI0014828122|nr:thermonuclease family protein [Bordetella genomosp. 7]